ncbi:hypothetical protein LAZ67_8003469 [Cordylochernes scorpioides]|uniref:Reverse transcriptase domain-containing protein n=1 Tax=Cordylochernes scorpioides TaxID=51811 RepID=A0ABY6KS44_9ARAC|nr:hypothetical protein LAZ67_8003469 [Cordylochernes scorpioides]
MAGERKQTRNSLSLSVKLQILREIEVEKKKKTDVAQKHNIPQSSLSTIIKNSEKIHQQALHAGESSRKRARGSTYADVDEALLQWFKQARSAALPVNGPLLSEKAKTLALEFGLKDFTGSGGWIERWKARHGIKLRNICGESADVNRETMTNWFTDVMPNIISNYACKDIFNADETGLFWRLLPDKTLHFKGETCTGGKASKERITILLCCNMDGATQMWEQQSLFDRMKEVLKIPDPVLSKHWEQLINFLDNNLLTIINGRTISDKTGNCTFISSRGSSVVDYFIVSYSLLEHVVDLKVDNNPYSDHLPLTINMSNLSNLKRTKETVYPCFERYRWAPDNTSLFSQNLDNNQVSTDQNLDSLVNTFSKQILNAMLAADMRIKVRPGRPKSKPWYSRECYLAKKSAKASLTTFKETNTDVDRNIYVSNRKRYTTLINFNKKKYLQEKQELLKNARDSANFWKTIATLKDKSYIQGNITILEWQCFYNKLLSAETTIGSDLSTLSRIDPELYCEISITEITREISSLANEKACGADEIPNEALKTLPFEHLVTLKNIFNRIINSGSYPLIWSKSIIHPIFKSGDRDNPSNYRGIALISNLSKLFTSILKSRLRNWIEGRSIIPENQAGFRKGYSCQDHIFTLLSLIQLTLRRKRRKLYAFFVDLKKAFDTVPHSLLWSKLGELGLDFRFVNLIRNYFEQMTTTVRWNGLFTEPIKIRSGVLQGEPLSPYLFILFVTDLINIFNDSTLPGIYLPNFGTVHLLMYADDIILIGESKINLQIKINMLKKYFETNHLTLNESKSKIMVFRNGGRPAKSDKWFWGDQLLTVTSKYLYLGYPLTTTISFSQVASYFKGKALAATGEVWKIMEKSRLNSFGSSMKLLDSIILSTLLYSAPIWANEKYKILDQIQNNYLRRLLNLPSNTPGYILRMETGRFSLGVTATKLILKFWLRILKMEKSRLPAICLAQLWETSTLTNAFIGFTENLMNILNSTGFMWLKNCSDPNILQKAIPQIIRITIEQSIQTDQSRITNSKLHTHYKYLHKTFAAENYLLKKLTTDAFRAVGPHQAWCKLYLNDQKIGHSGILKNHETVRNIMKEISQILPKLPHSERKPQGVVSPKYFGGPKTSITIQRWNKVLEDKKSSTIVW